MRYTSARRRGGLGHGTIYVRPPGKAKKTASTDITVPDDDPDGVVCGECGARVKALVSGRPRAHAPGGLATNTRIGRYKCEGSGRY